MLMNPIILSSDSLSLATKLTNGVIMSNIKDAIYKNLFRSGPLYGFIYIYTYTHIHNSH